VTDAQVLTLAIAVIVPLSMLIYSNSRISDAKETLRAEIKAETTTLRAEIQAESASLRAETASLRAEIAELRAHLDSGFDRIEHALKLHELEHHR
jgi:septal ring factor EnvC (AmiA/AmiB activator)